MVDEITFTIDGPDGSSDTVTLPRGLVSIFNEEDDPPATVVADLVQVAFTQRAHAIVHHGDDQAGEELVAIEDLALELFEERFGRTFAEVTGHDH